MCRPLTLSVALKVIYTGNTHIFVMLFFSNLYAAIFSRTYVTLNGTPFVSNQVVVVWVRNINSDTCFVLKSYYCQWADKYWVRVFQLNPQWIRNAKMSREISSVCKLYDAEWNTIRVKSAIRIVRGTENPSQNKTRQNEMLKGRVKSDRCCLSSFGQTKRFSKL